jgi:hypothetical protein
LVKTDANGDTLWTRLYRGRIAEGVVGDSTAQGTCVQQTPDGGYIVGGYGFLPSGEGWQDGEMLLFKTDADGDTLWTHIYRRGDLSEIDCLDQTTDGGYILVGFAGGSYPYAPRDIWLIKTDASGDTLWTRTFGKKNNTNSGTCVQQTSDGGYIVTGHMHAGSDYLMDLDLCLIKTDSLGDTTEVPAVSENLPLETDLRCIRPQG